MNTEELELEEKTNAKDDDVVTVAYDIASYPSDFTLKVLHNMFKDGDITIPDYQREFVWNIKQSSLLIESFLIGLPVPPIFLYIDDNNKNLVIDGQQRLLSIVYFIDGFFGTTENANDKKTVFRLKGLNENNRFYNKCFNDLSESDKKKLNGSVLRAINIRQLSPTDSSTSVYHIFERLNTGGTPLKPQEIRNCVFRSDFIDALKTINKDENWRAILGKSTAAKYQADVELILRAYGFSYKLSDYQKPMREFLNIIAKENMVWNDKIDVFIENFKRVTKLIVDKFPEKPFSPRGPFSPSVFDAVFGALLSNISNIPEDIVERYDILMQNDDFTNDTTLATTDKETIKRRFEVAEKILIAND